MTELKGSRMNEGTEMWRNRRRRRSPDSDCRSGVGKSGRMKMAAGKGNGWPDEQKNAKKEVLELMVCLWTSSLWATRSMRP